MKRLLLFAFLYCFALTRLLAQAPFATMDTVNINNIGAAVLVHGDMWWDPATGTQNCEFPTGSGKNMNSASALWMSGYDGSGQLHVAAQTYRQSGNDYWPGPLTSDTLTYTTSQNWAKIWKVNSTDIQSFLGITTHTTTNTPQSILTWPGKGNVNAQGNGGVPLTITNDMAPFVDINANGIYEPLLGEYPDIKGDQAVWWVFSDNGPTHTASEGKPIGMEVHAMSYAYKRGTLIDDVVYYDYTITNQSLNNYSNMRMAIWDDAALGWYYDNFIGFDSLWRMGVIYKGTNYDGAGGGNPVNSYGPNPPISAVTMIVLPGDVGNIYVPAGSFDYYNNDASVIGNPGADTIVNPLTDTIANPGTDTQCNNYMRAKLRYGQHFTDDFAGPGIPTVGYGSGPDCNYVFPGDPSDRTQWSECSCNNNPGDRRFVLSSNDFTLNAGSTAHFVFALIVADTFAGGCPVASFKGIRIVADTAWGNYYNPPTQSYTASISTTSTIQIFPNPAFNELNIVNNYSTGEAYIAIYNTLGQKINLPITQNGTGDIIDVSSLPTAMYYLVYRKDNIQKTVKFLKE